MGLNKMYEKRKQQLELLGFSLDGKLPFETWYHEGGSWICDFALEQYDEDEWDNFIKTCI